MSAAVRIQNKFLGSHVLLEEGNSLFGLNRSMPKYKFLTSLKYSAYDVGVNRSLFEDSLVNRPVISKESFDILTRN